MEKKTQACIHFQFFVGPTTRIWFTGWLLVFCIHFQLSVGPLSLSSISLFLGKKNVKSEFFDGNLSWLLVFQVDYGL